MSSLTITWIYCDVKGPNCWGGSEGIEGEPGQSVADHRRNLRAQGWLCSGRRDVCPDCLAATKTVSDE